MSQPQSEHKLKPEQMSENLKRHLEVVQWAREEIVRRKMKNLQAQEKIPAGGRG